jgi:DNA-binding NtrC family response regulator
MYSLHIPPLRERREEIPVLVEHFIEEHRSGARSPKRAGPAFLESLASRDLKGNVRELEGLVAGALVKARGEAELLPEHLPAEGIGRSGAPEAEREEVPGYAEMEREYVLSVLRLTDWNKKEAASLMKIPRTTLNSRIKKLGIVTGM